MRSLAGASTLRRSAHGDPAQLGRWDRHEATVSVPGLAKYSRAVFAAFRRRPWVHPNEVMPGSGPATKVGSRPMAQPPSDTPEQAGDPTRVHEDAGLERIQAERDAL